jgi:hypothetical protein
VGAAEISAGGLRNEVKEVMEIEEAGEQKPAAIIMIGLLALYLLNLYFHDPQHGTK